MTSLTGSPTLSLSGGAGVWEPLREALMDLRDCPGGRLLYVPREGHEGDALSAAGAWQLWDDLGMSPAHATLRDVRAGDRVLYGGGDSMPDPYFFEHCLRVNVGGVMVLPFTVHGPETVLASLDNRFTLVCGDLKLMDEAQRSVCDAQWVYAPDLALYLDPARLFAQCERYAGWRHWWRMAHNDRLLPYWRWRVLRSPAHESDESVWRGAEAYRSRFPLRAEADLVARDFLRVFDDVPHVWTRRLHIAVAAVLMGCEVTLQAEAHGEAHAAYDTWLSHLSSMAFEGVASSSGDEPAGGRGDAKHRRVAA